MSVMSMTMGLGAMGLCEVGLDAMGLFRMGSSAMGLGEMLLRSRATQVRWS